MIGYVTLGSDNMPRARDFYDQLLGTTIGAKRIMEFGDDLGGFTMWGTGFDKPGIAVTNPYNNYCPNYSSPLLVSPDSKRVLELASDYDGTICKTYYATGKAY